MNYDFPMIRTIDDVLPAIEGRKEFIVADRDWYQVINYVVAMPDSFTMTGPDDVQGAIRRECRGLIFDHEGKLISRPFHKFFNIGQIEETQLYRLDLSQPYIIMEKMDGSMLRPVLINGEVKWCSKMGVTSVGETAQAFAGTQPNIVEFANYCVANDLTALFEYTSPNNKIVLNYDRDNLTLLAVRENFSGMYVSIYP